MPLLRIIQFIRYIGVIVRGRLAAVCIGIGIGAGVIATWISGGGWLVALVRIVGGGVIVAGAAAAVTIALVGAATIEQ